MSVLEPIGACLRRVSTTQWEILDNSGHAPLGVTSVSIVGGKCVRLVYDFTADKVVTFSVTPDESFAAANVRCGGSVGLGYADIYFYMGASQVPVNPGLLSRAGANVWVSGLFLLPGGDVSDDSSGSTCAA